MERVAPDNALAGKDVKTAPRFYYGWICVLVAALAMVATLPGRTMGLGLVTEPLLQELRLSRTAFGALNLWATLLGAGFALTCGRLLDRFGSRMVLTVVSLALGLVVLAMCRVEGFWGLFVGVTLTRGLGQSALSAASIAVAGKWFERQIDLAMAVYSVLLTIGFMVAIPVMGEAVKQLDWRIAWGAMGFALVLGMAPAAWLLARDSPEAMGLRVDGDVTAAQRQPREGDGSTVVDAGQWGVTLGEALRTGAFWAFALSGLLFNTAYSGITLFNESILHERGFTGSPTGPLVVIVFTGLAANFMAGWLAGRWSASRLMGIAMLLLAVSLLALPLVRTPAQVMAYAAIIGVSGGVVTVVFFACWGKTFGRRHLGRIQGAAQTLTVLASAAGPLLLAECHTRTGSYSPIFYALVLPAVVLAVFCWAVRLPSRPDSASV